ncbi:chlorohydrolase [Sphingobacterium mizutaii NBRC 14946 = DSM 11724]|uniref:Chlorohydrolase n=2 Tax=Sphingobacterium mizutaii TaxID=1010 RepID=A0AAJ5C1S8_9SPHI|nr:amidohydrolase family protein [Sphingobacterium mizutaii]GEM68264.1 chlorohydrolase [Sphingobacterium mizutaii NBRC 14946 = DSM 11724]SDL80802.1 Cytosine/adenosine deaminase [Sphingobacterium mizutaii]SNV59480.1 chlorohydrolase [Sphingobacterium mizutaii]
MKYYAADVVFPVAGPAIKRGVVAMDDQGIVKGVFNPGEIDENLVEQFKGALIPGFVNAHCHLELSHLLGVVPRSTGLPSFLSAVINERGNHESKLEAAMEEADKMMYDNGIQAVGDHVNSAVTAKIKENSPIKYHTFVEVMAANKEDVVTRIDNAKEIEFHFDYKHSSITPHAPYSGSKFLFKTLKKAISEDNIISIHNQESDEENKLFRYKKGEFLEFFKKMDMVLEDFKAQARNSLQSFLPYIPSKNKLILVHNTYTSIKDLDFVDRMGRSVYFCFCPKANLYIEDRIPKIDNFLLGGHDIVIGTDSLASNDTLDILEELKVIHKEFPDLDFNETIKWATLNGAKALNLESELGSLEVGKKPGLVLLEGMDTFKLNPKVKVRRIR